MSSMPYTIVSESLCEGRARRRRATAGWGPRRPLAGRARLRRDPTHVPFGAHAQTSRAPGRSVPLWALGPARRRRAGAAPDRCQREIADAVEGLVTHELVGRAGVVTRSAQHEGLSPLVPPRRGPSRAAPRSCTKRRCARRRAPRQTSRVISSATPAADERVREVDTTRTRVVRMGLVPRRPPRGARPREGAAGRRQVRSHRRRRAGRRTGLLVARGSRVGSITRSSSSRARPGERGAPGVHASAPRPTCVRRGARRSDAARAGAAAGRSLARTTAPCAAPGGTSVGRAARGAGDPSTVGARVVRGAGHAAGSARGSRSRRRVGRGDQQRRRRAQRLRCGRAVSLPRSRHDPETPPLPREPGARPKVHERPPGQTGRSPGAELISKSSPTSANPLPLFVLSSRYASYHDKD
jgi:hypothetical protein